VPADLVSTDPRTNTFLFFDKEHPNRHRSKWASLRWLSWPLNTCFATETRIRTNGRRRTGRALRIGARAVLADGKTAPVIWIGHRDVVLPANQTRAPAGGPCARGRLCPGLARYADLFLSPDHRSLLTGC